MTGVTREDLRDIDFVDAVELRSTGGAGDTYKSSVTVVSTTAATKYVVVSGIDLLIGRDTPYEVGDLVVLAGNAAAGTYTIAALINATTLEVVEAIVDAGAGTVAFRYPVGARRVGFNSTGLTQTVANNVQDAISDLDGAISGGGITEAQHKALLHLIHFIDEGPAEGFATGATKTITGTVFPTQVLWRRADATKLVQQDITWTGVNATTIVWQVFAADGTTVLATVTDTISYSGVFETGRTRAIA